MADDLEFIYTQNGDSFVDATTVTLAAGTNEEITTPTSLFSFLTITCACFENFIHFECFDNSLCIISSEPKEVACAAWLNWEGRWKEKEEGKLNNENDSIHF